MRTPETKTKLKTMSFDLHYAENWTNLIMVNCRGVVAEGMALPGFDFNFFLVVSLQKTKNAIAPKQMTKSTTPQH